MHRLLISQGSYRALKLQTQYKSYLLCSILSETQLNKILISFQWSYKSMYIYKPLWIIQVNELSKEINLYIHS